MLMSLASRIFHANPINGVADWRYKLSLLGLFSVAYYIFYIYPNFSPLLQPRELPLLYIDRLVPFLPWTFVVYISDYLLFAALIIMVKDLGEVNSFARIAFGILFISGLFFLFFPTTYPRPDYPVEKNALVTFIMNLVENADTPNNCFPSLHVAMTAAAVWCVRRFHRKWFSIFAVWGLAIFVSTLTTKQHYFIDILGGLCVTVTVLSLERVLFYRKIAGEVKYAHSVDEKVTLEY